MLTLSPLYLQLAVLPEDLAFDKTRPTIISLRELDENDIETILHGIVGAGENSELFTSIRIHNWQGPRASRTDINHIFHRRYEDTPESHRDMYGFFIDPMLDKNGDLKLLAARKGGDRTNDTIELVPIQTTAFLAFWEAAAEGEGPSKIDEFGDIWSRENIFDLESHIDFGEFVHAPRYYGRR